MLHKTKKTHKHIKIKSKKNSKCNIKNKSNNTKGTCSNKRHRKDQIYKMQHKEIKDHN